MLQRFVERYRLWREQKAQENRDKNPLTTLAIVATLFVAIDLYKAVSSHVLTWRPAVGDLVLIAFLLLYVYHSRWAWVIYPLFGILCLVSAPLSFFSLAWRYPLRVRVIYLCLGLALGVLALVYGFVVRRRYELYLAERATTQNI